MTAQESSGVSPAPYHGDMKSSNSERSVHLENISSSASPNQHPESMESWETEDPTLPRNWPLWKKNAQILMVAFHSMVCTFMAAGIVPAYEAMAEDYGKTVHECSYLTSVQV